MDGIVQVAYVVSDLEAAARRWIEALGAGPFYVRRHVEILECTYRGQPAELDHTSALAQCGPIMIELDLPHGDGPSAFRDMYGPGEEGLHHVATFVPDLDAELDRLAGLGFEAANVATTRFGVRFAYVDTRPLLGHMLELYQDNPAVRGIYREIAEAAATWDGVTDPIRVRPTP